MKAIISIILAAMLMFTFTACGGNDDTGNGTGNGGNENNGTSMRDETTTDMNDAGENMGDIADDLTENGNVTNQTEEGILNDAMTGISDMLGGDEETTQAE